LPRDAATEDAPGNEEKDEEDTRMKDAPDFTSPRKGKRASTLQKWPPTKDRAVRPLLASTTPSGSPPQESSPEVTEKGPQGTLLWRAGAALLAQASASQTPLNGTSTRAASPAPPLIDPGDDVLSDSDLPEPWLKDYVPPATEEDCEDRADYLLKTRFKPMTDVQGIITSLTKYAPSQRSTENLYRLAENTQKILKAWQDEYLQLDAKVRTTVICIITA
jgi:hypothetical protein